ncbi:hypothetical protein D9757_008233 [Collybiopsis confluens]|uniref:Uncharacterized protein n=1 Tax=Collybiopsis confluens TaxID=2823264 RepID=A0A8H5HBH2_9AGAR|nr:hypothetical protein D9757_008233 [Collybiopsis confluens]
MAYASEIERARYSRQLAEYTLRQFSAARISVDSANMPPSQSQRLHKLLSKVEASGLSQRPSRAAEPSRRALKV